MIPLLINGHIGYLKKTLAKEDVERIVSGGVEFDIKAILEGGGMCPHCKHNPCSCK